MFSPTITQLTTTTTNHANNFNAINNVLIANDNFLKAQADASANKIDILEENKTDKTATEALSAKINILEEQTNNLQTDLGQRLGQRFRSLDGSDISIDNAITDSYVQGIQFKGATKRLNSEGLEVEAGSTGATLLSTESTLSINENKYSFYEPVIEGVTTLAEDGITEIGLEPTDNTLPSLFEGDSLDRATKTITFADGTIRGLTTEEFEAYDVHKKVIYLNGIGDISDSLRQDRDGDILLEKLNNVEYFDGTENWAIYDGGSADSDTIMQFITEKLNLKGNFTCDKWSNLEGKDTSSYGEGVYVHNNLGYVYLRIKKEKLLTQDIEGLKKYLKSNPFSILGNSITPTITYIDHRATPTIPISNKQINISFGDSVKPSSAYIDVLVEKLVYDNQYEQAVHSFNQATNELERQIALLEYQQVLGGVL